MNSLRLIQNGEFCFAFVLINEIMINVIVSLSLQYSDPWVDLVTGEVIPNSTSGTVGCSLGAFLTGCWLKVPMQRAFLQQCSQRCKQGVKSGRTYVDEGETVSWL